MELGIYWSASLVSIHLWLCSSFILCVKIWLTDCICISEKYGWRYLISNLWCHLFFFLVKIKSLYSNGDAGTQKETDGGWRPMNAKCCILGCFKKRMILLCQGMFKTKRLSNWYRLDSFTIPLMYFTDIFLSAPKFRCQASELLHVLHVQIYICI